ncbi:MAG: hypothetical protein R3Y27_04225 [Clostridia bacterium]
MQKYNPTIEIQNKYGVLDLSEFDKKSSGGCSGGCCGGGSHDSESSSGCCGGSDSSGCCKNKVKFDIEKLGEKELEILELLKMNFNLPIVEFVLKSSKESDFESICLSPVLVLNKEDDLETVKQTAKALKVLESEEFIIINLDESLKNCTYEEYEDSNILNYFKQTVENAKQYPNFLGDIAVVEKGFIALNYDYLISIDEGYETK